MVRRVLSRKGADYRILDKDLDRIGHAETARLHAARPMLGLGVAALFVTAVTIVALGVFAGQPGLATIGAGMVVATYLALSIGANDLANSLGPAHGSGAVGLTAGLVLVALAEIAGALLAGDAVSQRLAAGIVMPDQMYGATGQPSGVMTPALLAAAIWISAATAAGIPVSTTHAIVGGIAGAGFAAFGADGVLWGGLTQMALGWMIAPVVSGVGAALILAILGGRLENAPDRMAAARRWLPPLIGLTISLFTIYLGWLLLGMTWQWVAALVAIFATVGWWHTRRVLDRIAQSGDEPVAGWRRLFALPLLWSAVLMGFAHGANDVGNVAAPLAAIVRSAGADVAGDGFPPVVLLAAGGGIALGALLFGRRLVTMVGSGITRLNAIRAFCVTLATAATVLGASLMGLPVSTTHVTVGGVFGVGFYREFQDRRRGKTRSTMPAEETRRRILVRRSQFATILTAWLVTLPATAILAGIMAGLFALMRGT